MRRRSIAEGVDFSHRGTTFASRPSWQDLNAVACPTAVDVEECRHFRAIITHHMARVNLHIGTSSQKITCMRHCIWGFVVILTAGALFAWPARVQSQEPSDVRTVQDGVFTEEQALRGRHQYQTTCGRCHGEDLTGSNARALVGDTFLRNWSSLSLDGLFDRVQTMPPGGAMTLGEDTYVDILTYVLETNGFPAGSEELRSETLPEIIVEGADGPQEVPDFSLVQVVGCLTSGPANTWILTDATEPIRTLDPAASTNEGRILVETVTLGTGSYELIYVFPAPDGLVGHRVEAKGFLIRGDQDQINITTLESVSLSCT